VHCPPSAPRAPPAQQPRCRAQLPCRPAPQAAAHDSTASSRMPTQHQDQSCCWVRLQAAVLQRWLPLPWRLPAGRTPAPCRMRQAAAAACRNMAQQQQQQQQHGPLDGLCWLSARLAVQQRHECYRLYCRGSCQPAAAPLKMACTTRGDNMAARGGHRAIINQHT
jgi:hypothetical protein